MSTDHGVILVAGAINTDLVATMNRAPEAGETITGTSFATYGGGKGANQAVAAARSGGSVSLVGALGDDAFGGERRTDLERDGISTMHVQIDRELASGVALILVETGGENRIAYVPGATMGVSVEVALLAFDVESPAMVLATNELPHETLLALFGAASARGISVVFNAAPDPGTCGDLLPHVTVLIANAGEAKALAGLDEDSAPGGLVDVLQSWTHVGIAILTAGKDGAYMASEDSRAHVGAPKVEVVDTTGAGDTFCGAFAAEYLRGGGVEGAMRFAVAASALSVTKAGAQPSIPSRSEVEAFLAKAT